MELRQLLIKLNHFGQASAQLAINAFSQYASGSNYASIEMSLVFSANHPSFRGSVEETAGN
jgi:hypothetical protein